MAELRWGAATHAGQVRTTNEDNLYTGPTLFVVADGMGGHEAGEVASQLTVDRLESSLTADTPTLSDLVETISEANRDIFDAALANPEQQGMGTTVTSLAVMEDPDEGEVFALANVGDSRTYLFRHGRLRQLTVDHSYVQELVAEGHISKDEARHHPRRNIVTRALGIERSIRVDSWTLPIIRGDRFVLCSDGLVDEADESEITAVLVDADDPQTAADRLVDLANANGGRDNVTVVVVDVLEGGDPPDPTEEIDVVPAWAPPDESNTDDDIARIHSVADTSPEDTPLVGAPTGPPVGPPAEPPADLVVHPDADGAPPPPPVDGPAATGDADPTWVVSDPNVVPTPELAELEADSATAAGGDPPKRRRRALRFALVIGVTAVVVTGFTIFAAWARSGYFVAFDDSDRVVIYRGQTDRILWFDATVEAPTPLNRDVLDEPSIQLVDDERRFSALRSAETFVNERLTTTTTTTTAPSTTTTTVPPTTAVPDESESDSGVGGTGGVTDEPETGTTTGS